MIGNVRLLDKSGANVLSVAGDGSLVTSFQAGTLTKGVQNATGFSTQDLKDSGRVTVCWTIDQVAFGSASETLASVTESRDGAATTTFTSKVITSGKRLRITSIFASLEAAGSVVALTRAYLGIRVNTVGAVTTASPLQFRYALGVAATLKAIGTIPLNLVDGLEFSGDGTKQIGITTLCPDYVTTVNVPVLTLSIFGFEY